MIRRLLPLALVLVISLPGSGQDEGREAALAAFRIEMKVQDGDPAGALELAGAFVLEHFGDPETMNVLPVVARIRMEHPALAKAADAVLRDALNLHPFEYYRETAVDAIEGTRGWSFSRGEMGPKSLERRGSEVFFELVRSGGPPSTYRIHLIPADVIRAAALTLPEDGDLEQELGLRRDTWKLVDERVIPFAPGARRKYFRREMPKAGLYVLEEEIDGFRLPKTFRVGSFAPVVRTLGKSALVIVADPWTGEPVPGARVTVRDGFLESRTREMVTNESGIALFDDVADDGRLLVEREDETVVLPLDISWWDARVLCHVTTDRTVYRPGDTVNYRAIRRDREGGRLETPKGAVHVGVAGENEVLLDRDAEWSRFGTVCGSFDLPEDASLGTGHIFLRHAGVESGGPSAEFRIADYERPEIRVSVTPDPDARILGEPLRAIVRAEHWWGAPAAGIGIAWNTVGWEMDPSAHDKSHTGRWQGRPFPDPREWFYDGDAPWPFHGNERPELDREGEGRTGEDGTFTIVLPSEPAKWPVKVEYRIEATGPSGRPVRTVAKTAAYSAALRVKAGATRMFYEPGADVEAGVRVTDLDGEPQVGREVRLTLFRGETFGRTIEFAPMRDFTATTGEDGLASFRLTAPESGRLRLHATARDDEGRVAVHRVDVWIASEKTIRRPGERDDRILVVPERVVHAPGEIARVLVDWPDAPRTAWLTLSGDRFHEARAIRIERRFQVIDVPIRATYAPGVYLKVLGVSGAYVSRGFPKAEIGGTELLVLPAEGWLDVEIDVEPGTLGPRETSRIRVRTTRAGRPVTAEVELAIVDEAIFRLVPDESADVRSFFSSSFEDDDWARGIGPFRFLILDGWEERIATGRNYHPGFGFGMGAPPAQLGMAPARVRRFSPPTLFWKGDLVTGDDGVAEVEVETSDRLTDWRILARAVAADGFGQERSRLVTRKDVVVRLAAPPSMTERDEGEVAVSVRSDLERAAEFVVGLTVSGAGEGGGEKRIRVAAGTEETVRFPLRATGPGEIVLLAEALSGEESDAVERRLSVRAHGTKSVARAEGAADPVFEATLDLPEGAADPRISVEVDTVASAIRRALPQIEDWGRGERGIRIHPDLRAWRLVALLRGLRICGPEVTDGEAIRKEIRALASLQLGDGGFSRAPPTAGDPAVTATVLLALVEAREAGLEVPAETFRRTVAFLRKNAKSPLGVYALSRVPVALPEDAVPEARTAAGADWLVLAGHPAPRAWPPVPDRVDGRADLLGNCVQLAAIAKRSPHGSPELELGIRHLLAVREGGAWRWPEVTALAIFGLSHVREASPPEEPTITLNGRTVPGAPVRPGANALRVESEGLAVTRRFERARATDDGLVWSPLSSEDPVKVGERLRVVLEMRADARAPGVEIRCPLPGGAIARKPRIEVTGTDRWFDRSEFHLHEVRLLLHRLPVSTRTYAFELRPVLPGTWHAMPATATRSGSGSRGRSDEFVLRVGL